VSVQKTDPIDPKKWTLAGSSWAGAWKAFAGIGVLGLVGSGVGYTMDARRFAFSWMFAFITMLTITLGAMIFVIIQRLVSAGWSVTVRRTAEVLSLGVIPLAVLFLPILLCMGHLFPWLHAEHEGAAPAEHSSISLITPAFAQEHAEPGHGNPPPHPPGDAVGKLPGSHAGPPGDSEPHPTTNEPAGHATHRAHGPMGDPHAVEEHHILQAKAGYLNRNFFLARAAIYFIVWNFLALRFFNLSADQDKSKDPKLTLRAQALSAPATLLYGITLTFAAFDWIMSLEPTWFSTIFGVYYFACGVVSSYATIILVTLALRTSGPLKGAVTPEHYHDLGKLMFGFLVFWAYTSFSQLMLIWYAALPEETTFFHNRWDYAPWQNMSYAIIFAGFVLPFFWTISRWFKRNTGRLKIGALIILVMHVVDMYWYVMPNYHLGKEGFTFHWLDATCLLAVAGIWGAFVFNRMGQHATVPIGDPRLQRSLEFVNA
jgi:hypothetical protein